ncbi:helix-turn-helix domain-containing protein [Paracoccus sphaerophysae]|uniref:helix-turn-helix domain-containing protein n=1 Tax=Paracoccus sphaerophysae TaxID=690417 RepID=UPI0018DE539E|nr:helix-turn-helix domain-containing protein [Paracoccus sphaerophysae]
MALNLIVAALERGPASPTDALVLIAICDSADKVSGEAWPSLRSLAQAARVTPRAVRSILARLVSDGWIEIERRHRANGSQASNLYRVNLALLGELRPPPEAASSLEPSHHKEPKRGGRRAREIAGERKGKASAWSPKPAASASAAKPAPEADVLAFYADLVIRKAPGVRFPSASAR